MENIVFKKENIVLKENSKISFGIIKLKKGWNKFVFNGEGKSTLVLKSKTFKNIYVGELNTIQSIYIEKNKYAYMYIISSCDTKIKDISIISTSQNDLINMVVNNKNMVIVSNPDDPLFIDFIAKSKHKYDILSFKQNKYSRYINNNGMEVYECNYSDFREILMEYKYDNILFWDYDYECLKAITKSDYHATQLYFKNFVTKNNYFNYTANNSIYGCVPAKMSAYFISEYQNIKNLFSMLTYSSNCNFIFETPEEKDLYEEKLGVTFNNYTYIENGYNIVKGNKKKASSELRIAIVKEFSEYSKNALDIDKKIIEEFSKKSILDNVNVTFVGKGIWKDILLENVLNSKNVSYIESIDNNYNFDIVINTNRDYINLENVYNFMSNGIPVIINNSKYYNIKTAKEMLIENNNVEDIINIIEKLQDKEYYNKIVEENNAIIEEIEKNDTNKKILDYIKNNAKEDYKLKSVINKEPVLSIIIPAYNVQKYVPTTIWSLVNQKNYQDIEILVVNDGSKDDTLKVVNNIKDDLFDGVTTVLKIIDKPNGGHGSVINVGLEKITGKYVKIVDGDDTLNSTNLANLIDYLKDENADVILNDYKEDYIATNNEEPINFYENVPINTLCDFETLCKEKIFVYWGPLLPTATYNVKNLKKRKFLISEKILYDDMEWNFNSIMNVNSVKYLDTYIYNHFIGREGQSITFEGLVRNYKMHRTMTINLINLYLNNKKNINDYKKEFLFNNYVLKMIKTHYRIAIDYFKDNHAFKEFDHVLKAYPEFYNNKDVVNKKIKVYRMTNGLVKYLGFMVPVYRKLKAIIGR